MSAKIHKLKDVKNCKYKSLVRDIKTCLNEALASLLSNMLDNADDALFRLAELAQSNEDQNHYFDAMRTLRLERKNISGNFLSSLNTHLKPIYQTEKTQEKSSSEEELTLVDQDEMEEMVAISAMHSRAMSLFGDSINILDARLEMLAMKTKLIFDQQALQPKNICAAFQTALKPVELSIKNKLIVYKLFDKDVCSQMADCYQAINQLLIAADILPKIKPSTAQHRTNTAYHTLTAPPVDTETVQTATDAGIFLNQNSASVDDVNYPSISAVNYVSAHHSDASSQHEINQTIRQFLHGDITSQHAGHSISPSAQGGIGNTQYYRRRDVLSALSSLQQNTVTTVNTTDFKRALLNQMGSSRGGAITKQVNRLDEKTIDFIDMLFKVIIEDNSVSDVITNLLLRLQIPIIKTAMLDEKIFCNNQHPARRLLNLIVETGKSISDKNDKLYPLIEKEIDCLLKDFDIDVISFQKAIDNINAIINQGNLLAEATEKETQKSILQEHARMIVLNEMQYRLAGKHLPHTARPLILKLWSTLMFHRYIRNGRNSIAWQEVCNILALLINSLQPIKSPTSLRSLKNNYLQLLAILKDSLYATKQKRDAIDTSLQSLEKTYALMITEAEYNSPEEQEASLIEATPSACDVNRLKSTLDNTSELSDEHAENNPLDHASQQARDKIATLPGDVRPGVWFEIFNGEDRAVRRLKLSVIIMQEAKLIFVDRLGIKIIEKDAALFSAELSAEKSKIIADHSAFDSALSKVITSLSAQG
jgi:hypothetical protein